MKVGELWDTIVRYGCMVTLQDQGSKTLTMNSL